MYIQSICMHVYIGLLICIINILYAMVAIRVSKHRFAAQSCSRQILVWHQDAYMMNHNLIDDNFDDNFGGWSLRLIPRLLKYYFLRWQFFFLFTVTISLFVGLSNMKLCCMSDKSEAFLSILISQAKARFSNYLNWFAHFLLLLLMLSHW